MKHLRAALAVTLSLAGTGITAYGDEGHQHKPGAKAHGQPHASPLGKPGNAKNFSRSVEIAMDDSMRFIPSSIEVKKGETIRFVLKNGGKLKHEMVLGTIEELEKHAALMLKFPEMEHADPNQASVEPGKTGELIWQFTKSGNFDFACLQAGHYEAGMEGKVTAAAVAMKGK